MCSISQTKSDAFTNLHVPSAQGAQFMSPIAVPPAAVVVGERELRGRRRRRGWGSKQTKRLAGSNRFEAQGGIYTAPNPPRSYLECRSRASGAMLAKPPSETTKMGRRGCFDNVAPDARDRHAR